MNKKLFKFIVLLFFLFLGVSHAFAGLRGQVNKGNDFYHKQEYDKALEKYRDGLIEGLYKKENYEEAIKEYNKATYSKDIQLQSKSYYNIGNCLYRLNKLPEAIQFYKKALELNPDDEDSKYNIEFVQKKIKENLSKQPQQQQQQQQQKQEEKEQQQGEKEKQKDEMSKEDAERLLKAFEEDEKEAQKRKKMPAPAGGGVERDW
jgi:Ca-activated chloride channel family protein